MLSASWCLISPAAHLRIEMKSALEAYLVQAALLIYSGVLLVSTHVYFAINNWEAGPHVLHIYRLIAD